MGRIVTCSKFPSRTASIKISAQNGLKLVREEYTKLHLWIESITGYQPQFHLEDVRVEWGMEGVVSKVVAVFMN